MHHRVAVEKSNAWHSRLDSMQVSPEAAATVAADKALGGGLKGAAATAAARAAALGAKAAREGYSKLGGVSEHIKLLQQHVTLPLKVRNAYFN